MFLSPALSKAPGYMVVTGLFLCIPVYLLPFLFPDFYEDERWTVGKHLLNNLFIFFFIAVGLWLYSDWIFGWGCANFKKNFKGKILPGL